MTAPLTPTITPAQFIARWQDAGFGERQGAQSFFNDLCALTGHPTPAAYGDPDAYTFEKRVTGGFSDAAQTHFEQVVQQRDLPNDMPEYRLADVDQYDLIAGTPVNVRRFLVQSSLASSNAEGRRLIAQSAIEILSRWRRAGCRVRWFGWRWRWSGQWWDVVRTGGGGLCVWFDYPST